MIQQHGNPTASQFASAACHLERRADWRFYGREGVRYVAIPSGTSEHTYAVRADAHSCECLWNEQTWTMCSHMLAVSLDATMDELATEDAVVPTFREFAAALPGCAAGCGRLADGLDYFCNRCASEREHEQHLAAKRENQAALRRANALLFGAEGD